VIKIAEGELVGIQRVVRFVDRKREQTAKHQVQAQAKRKKRHQALSQG
jgi:hypothetical protein